MQGRMDESEFVFTYDGIGAELGISGRTLQRRLKLRGIVLSKWGYGATSCVYLSKCVVKIARRRLK
jgi:hypothetical protein